MSSLSRLRQQMELAQRAQEFVPHIAAGAVEPHAFSRVPPVATSIFGLGDELPNLFGPGGQLRHIPSSLPTGETISFGQVVAANSRVFRAGAQFLVRSDRKGDAAAVGREGAIVMRRDESSFRVVRPLRLSMLADDAEVVSQGHPVDTAHIEWSDVPNYSARIELPRIERRKVDPDLLCGEILAAVALGIGQAVDQVLLSAILAATPSPPSFNLGNVAASGLSFAELRAIVGTLGIGATVGQDGSLRVEGVNAELSDATTVSLIGSFARSAVALDDHIELHIERLGQDGGMAATLHLGLLPLVPTSDFFWMVA